MDVFPRCLIKANVWAVGSQYCPGLHPPLKERHDRCQLRRLVEEATWTGNIHHDASAASLTCQELSDLFDEVSQVVVGALHLVLGGCGFIQSCLGFTLGLLRLGLSLCYLRERQTCLQWNVSKRFL